MKGDIERLKQRTPQPVDHDQIRNVEQDQHHPKEHSHDGSDGSGSVSYEDLTNKPASSLVPTGVVLPYGGTAAPTGYLMADGSVVSRTTYVALFAVVGTAYNTGGEAGTDFRLPDLRQRFPLGKAAAGTGSVLGSSGGNIDHVHSGPAHTHAGPAHTHSVLTHTHPVDPPNTTTGTPSSTVSIQEGGGAAKTPAGGSHTHDVNIGSFDSGSSAPADTGSSGTGNTGSSGTGDTGTANSPYQTFNYIIKT